MSKRRPPVALTIAGSDSGAGAGIQADLKTFAAHGVYGTCALTLVTAQNTRGISGMQLVHPELVAEQVRAVLDDFPVAAVKTGALGSAETIVAVAEVLRGARLPLVVDPVLDSTSGTALLAMDALSALREHLLPMATLVTPNLPEAEVLFGEQEPSRPSCALLLKGGHAGGLRVRDELRLPGQTVVLESPRQFTRHTHGTGCTLSAAITANLARGFELARAVQEARAYVQAALREAPGLGAGAGPLGHFPGKEP